MKKSLLARMLALAMPTISFCILHADEESPAGETKADAKKTRTVEMDDGRKLEFTEKQRMQKAHGVEGANVFARIDFENGKVVKVYAFAGNLPDLATAGDAEGADEAAKDLGNAAKMTLQLIGHGMVQKLGDAAAGAETTEDALEAVLEVAGRIAKNQWKKTSEGGGSAKGAGELVAAMHEFLQETTQPDITKDQVRELLSQLTAQEKTGLRKVPDVAAKIEKIRAARKPSEADTKKAEQAKALLEALKAGKVPERPAAEGGESENTEEQAGA